MIRNRRFSRFNENRGLRRRFYEGDKFSSQEDFRMVGVAGMKFAAVAERLLKEIHSLWKTVTKDDRYESELQHDHVVTMGNLADKIIDNYDKYMSRANSLAKSKYGVSTKDPWQPGVESTRPDKIIDELLNPEYDVAGIDDCVWRLKHAASIASGEESDNGNINETARFEDIIHEANNVMALSTILADAAYDVAESVKI